LCAIPGLSNKEWIRQTLDHKEFDYVPYNFIFMPVSAQQAIEVYGTDLNEALDMPLRFYGPETKKPMFVDPDEFGPTITDEFGVTWSTSKIDRGAPIGPSLKEPTLDGFTFPDPEEESRFEWIEQWCEWQKDHYRGMIVGDLWERATFMRGMENLLVDTLLNPRFVEALLNELTDYILKGMTKLFEMNCDFECIFLMDDYGMQRSTIISPDQWRKFVKPCLAKIYGLAKDRQCDVFHHTCGHNTPIIGDMIDLGLDILHPIQPEAMDIKALKREFGKDVTFCGGLSTQDLLINGNPQQVRDQVRWLKDYMARDGGYIFDTGLAIQADVPKENMLAMIDEATRPKR
jgi:uroporphyrinogen decarboxylase